MLKIKKEKKSDWLLCAFDFRSLQMCLAFADAGLNKNGIDKIGYTMYSDSIMTDRALGKDLSDIDKSKALIGDNDAHSHTGFSTFVESVAAAGVSSSPRSFFRKGEWQPMQFPRQLEISTARETLSGISSRTMSVSEGTNFIITDPLESST